MRIIVTVHNQDVLVWDCVCGERQGGMEWCEMMWEICGDGMRWYDVMTVRGVGG